MSTVDRRQEETTCVWFARMTQEPLDYGVLRSCRCYGAYPGMDGMCGIVGGMDGIEGVAFKLLLALLRGLRSSSRWPVKTALRYVPIPCRGTLYTALPAARGYLPVRTSHPTRRKHRA